jgi:hypothetical protein
MTTTLALDDPVLTSVTYEQKAFDPGCSLPWSCSLGAWLVTLQGSSLGSAPGRGGGIEFAQSIAPPTPVAAPPDLPDALQLSALAPYSQNGCLPPSDAASTDFSFEVCPFATSYLRTPGPTGRRVGSLGTFSGVVRSNSSDCENNDNCDSAPPFSNLAVTGLLFSGGDACGNGGTLSAVVNFVCTSRADPWQLRYEENATVNAASLSADGCTWSLDVPLDDACSGDNFELCSCLTATPTPIPSPSPIPFTYPPSTMLPLTWGPSTVTLYLQPTSSLPLAARARRYDGRVSPPLALVAAPAPPSASPIPNPFPSTLTVLSVVPNSVLSVSGAAGEPIPPCVPITITVGGVAPDDLEGFSAHFDLALPRGPNLMQNYNLYGAPLAALNYATIGLPNNATRAPPNGLLTLVLPCPHNPFILDAGGFSAPYTAKISVSSQYSFTQGGPLRTRRTAGCATPSACAFTLLGGGGPPAPPSASSSASAPLSGAALFGAVGGGVAALLLAAFGLWYFTQGVGSSAGSAGSSGGKQGAAWPPTSASPNPLAAGEGGVALQVAASSSSGAPPSLHSPVSPGAYMEAPGSPGSVPEWGSK